MDIEVDFSEKDFGNIFSKAAEEKENKRKKRGINNMKVRKLKMLENLNRVSLKQEDLYKDK